jgi:hypothetical protein
MFVASPTAAIAAEASNRIRRVGIIAQAVSRLAGIPIAMVPAPLMVRETNHNCE